MHKSWKILGYITLISIALTACERSAGSAPATATESLSNNDVLSQVETAQAQQTALAGNGIGGGVESGTDEAYLTQSAITPTLNLVNTATATQAPTNTPAPTLSVDTPTEYEIKSGEFVYCLARRFDIDAQAILDVNGFGRGVVLSTGNVIRIPTDASPFQGNRALQAHPASYTVQEGDTLNSIACLFGDVYPEEIAQANDGIDINTELVSGTIINIP